MPLDDTDKALKERWLSEVFRPELKKPGTFDTGEQYHWESMAYGFFLALGVGAVRAQYLARTVDT